MSDHAVVGANGESFDVPSAHQRLELFDVGEARMLAQRLDRAGHLGDRRDVTDDDSPSNESITNDVNTFPRCEHVEDHTIHFTRCERLGQFINQVADANVVRGGGFAKEAGDVGLGNLGEFGATFKARYLTGLPHGAKK